ncbi:MAG: sensor histidine kinase [Sphingomicrobium sp.]|jgi:hypothetical protein
MMEKRFSPASLDAIAGPAGAEVHAGLRRPGFLPPRLTFYVIGGFWLTWYVAYVARSLMNDPEPMARSMIVPRLLIAGSGALLSCGIAIALERLRFKPMSVRAVAAVLLSIVGTVIHTLLTYKVWTIFVPDTEPSSSLWLYYATDFIFRIWFFASQSAIILSLSYAADVVDREDRIHSLQGLAQAAQLRALRNQLNPHFLFNALNSVAALISVDRPSEAEVMTENLSDFLRLTLSLDPQQLIPLEEELRLQRLYLDIEQVRFPGRLQVDVDVTDEARRAMVPSLISQPLIENTIKYAVTQSTEPVQLTIYARVAEHMLELVIADDGGNSPQTQRKGAGVGLTNVSDRLRTHFGTETDFAAGSKSGGGFRSILRMPIRTA